MRIKKKHVLKESLILEGLLIDDLTTLDAFDKKVLKGLHKRFKDVSMWDIDTYDLIDELHEKWLMPLSKAFKLVHTYVYKRDYLFKEHDYVSNVKNADIFRRYGRKFYKKYRDSLDDEHLTPDGEFWDISVGDKTLPYEPHFWDQWNGYSIYLPVDYNLRWNARGSGDKTDYDNYTAVVSVNFNWEEDTFNVEYRIGKDDNEQKGTIVNNHSFEYPKDEISYAVGTAWVENHVMNIVKPLIQQFNFPSVEDDGTGM
jgi:hypothetical protein